MPPYRGLAHQWNGNHSLGSYLVVVLEWRNYAISLARRRLSWIINYHVSPLFYQILMALPLTLIKTHLAEK